MWHFSAMPKQPGFKPIPDAKRGFMVSVPAAMTGHGARERRFFKDEREAEKFASTLRGQYAKGQRGAIIDAGLARMAAEAAKLVPSGASILEWVKEMGEMVALVAPLGISPLDACRAVAKQHLAGGAAETFRERFDRFRGDNESNWSDRYQTDFDKIPRWVGEGFMGSKCAAINPAVIEEALRKHGATSGSTVRMRKRYVMSALTAKEKPDKRGEIKIMSVTQCAAMLRACRDRAEVRAVALLMFAGVRPDAPDGELGRLQWEHVEADHIDIHPEVSKTGTDRHIAITPRLARLLRGHPAEGSVVPPNWHRRIQAIRKAAGVAGDQDVARHTFASNYLVEFGEDAAKSAMGHTANSSTLFRHYRRAVKPAAAAKYFR